MDSDLNNLYPFQPDLLVRYLVYEDFTRRRAMVHDQFWAERSLIRDMLYGKSFRINYLHPEEYQEGFVIANRPALVKQPHPKIPSRTILVYDVYLAPIEQWMLYEHQDPDEVSWAVEIYSMESEF